MNASDRGAGDFFAEHIHRSTMSKIYVMHRPVKIVFAAPVSLAQGAAEKIEDRRLVKCSETFDTISETRGDQCRIVGKPCRQLPIQPSANILESLGKIPMIQAQPRLDAGGQQFIDQPIVEGKTRSFAGPRPCGNTRGQATENR